MSLEIKKVWTGYVTSGTLTIDASYGFTTISIVLQSGAGTVQGGLLANNGVASAPINLTVGQAINFNSGTSSSILDGIEIITTGTVYIVAR